MTENLQSPQSIGPASTNPAIDDGIRERRRRFLRGSVATGSVVMTLASRPALAGTCTFSGAQSSGSGTALVCKGSSPGCWRRQTTYPYPIAYFDPTSKNTPPKEALFFYWFSFLSPGSGTDAKTATVALAVSSSQAVNVQGTSGAFAWQAAAALLNAACYQKYTPNPFGYSADGSNGPSIITFIQNHLGGIGGTSITDVLSAVNGGQGRTEECPPPV